MISQFEIPSSLATSFIVVVLPLDGLLMITMGFVCSFDK